ncbi:FxsA family protein [Yersinia sp. 1652 StPb PI]|uniref:FxsA family protein n=1 Tax=unclassified Yersinia (in: enterobacteria) TaxID=2653513 RepID=UPI00355B8168
MRWLPLALIFLLAYIEISIFIKVAAVLGVLVTLLLVILSSCVGISLVRNQGIKTFMQMQQKLAAGESPAAEMVKSVSLILAGFLLLIPGFFTDFLGLLLLLPPIQKSLTLKLMPHLNIYRGGGFTHNGTGPMGGGNTFDGEFQRKADDHYTVEHHPDEDDKPTDNRFKDEK